MMTYEYDQGDGIIHLKSSGILAVEDPVRYFEELERSGKIVEPALEKVYFTETEDIDFSFSGVQKIRTAFKVYNHAKKISKAVFVVDSDFSYGMARLVTSVLNDVLPDYAIERR